MENRIPKLFFSHSQKDVALLEHLVEAAVIGLRLRTEDIICSSLKGYSIRSGYDFVIVARDSGIKSNCLIGVITPNSLESSWVLFELGARWGANKYIVIILANGATLENLPQPLRNLIVVNCVESELETLFTDIGHELKVKFKYNVVRNHLRNAEIISQAAIQRKNNNLIVKKVEFKLKNFSASIKFLTPKDNSVISREFVYKIQLENFPKEKNTLWICHEVAGEVWPKEELQFVGNVAEGALVEGGTPPNGLWNLIVIETDEEGQTDIRNWLQNGAKGNGYPGFKELKAAKIADLSLILDRK